MAKAVKKSVMKKPVSSVGDKRKRKSSDSKECVGSESDDERYDPVYDISFQFALLHGYGNVVFEDNKLCKPSKRDRTDFRKGVNGKPVWKSANAFLPHVPVVRDRKNPVSVVRYKPHHNQTSRGGCGDETCRVLESVLCDMKLIQSAMRDIDMVKTVSNSLHELDVTVPSSERPCLSVSQKVQKRRQSGSRHSSNRASIPKPSVSQHSLDGNGRRVSPQDDAKGNVRTSNTTDTILSSAPLDEYKEYISDLCMKIFQEQPSLSPVATKPKKDASSIRKCAEGDTGEAEDNFFSQNESPEVKKSHSPVRPANLKLKTKKVEMQRAEYLKKYYRDKTEENHSFNNSPNNGDPSMIRARVFHSGEATISKKCTEITPSIRTPTDNIFRLSKTVSSIVVPESLLLLRSHTELSEINNSFLMTKIDFVRVRDGHVKKVCPRRNNSLAFFNSVRRIFVSIPRILHGAHCSPPLCRKRCNLIYRPNPVFPEKMPGCSFVSESCHTFRIHQPACQELEDLQCKSFSLSEIYDQNIEFPVMPEEKRVDEKKSIAPFVVDTDQPMLASNELNADQVEPSDSS